MRRGHECDAFRVVRRPAFRLSCPGKSSVLRRARARPVSGFPPSGVRARPSGHHPVVLLLDLSRPLPCRVPSQRTALHQTPDSMGQHLSKDVFFLAPRDGTIRGFKLVTLNKGAIVNWVSHFLERPFAVADYPTIGSSAMRPTRRWRESDRTGLLRLEFLCAARFPSGTTIS